MSSIYNKSDNDLVISRINNLSPDTKALWGKMDSSQMLSHCQMPLDVAFGDLKLKSNFLMQLLGKMLKGKILKAEEFKKNSPTAPAFIRNFPCDFEQSKSDLIEKISRLSQGGIQAIKTLEHPFFGNMDPNEWDILIWKHMDHHLRQFGV